MFSLFGGVVVFWLFRSGRGLRLIVHNGAGHELVNYVHEAKTTDIHVMYHYEFVSILPVFTHQHELVSKPSIGFVAVQTCVKTGVHAPVQTYH